MAGAFGKLGVEWRLDPTHETEYTLGYFERGIAAAGLYINHKEIRWDEIRQRPIKDNDTNVS